MPGRQKNKTRKLNAHRMGAKEREMTTIMDNLMEFEAFKEMPKNLREAIADNVPADQLFKNHTTLAAARIIQIAMTEPDPKKALLAAKDILDRVYGKATEKKIIKHELDALSDTELDALLKSKLRDVTPSKK